MKYEITEMVYTPGSGGGNFPETRVIDVPDGEEPPAGAVPVTEKPKGKDSN